MAHWNSIIVMPHASANDMPECAWMTPADSKGSNLDDLPLLPFSTLRAGSAPITLRPCARVRGFSFEGIGETVAFQCPTDHVIVRRIVAEAG